eukprot:CAMPEP_0170547208 /NCGR_PEP_ID=MMETSP0211-20121228/5568_1 /TAXON_ID=311385 /ORGANISM="Pseudokeronopsis sp., Strain OXSARD2" /LENGTH=53 /DNA_ID=CAMNT_0010852083 /DNA_START=242 /DNA_END=403 /DNA_ORIENTATION=+
MESARRIHRDNLSLEEAKNTGLACEDIAHDIKFNLAGQTEKMKTKVLRNLDSM